MITAVRTRGGFVLDGFPRTLAQAEAAAVMAGKARASAQAAVYLDVPQDVVIARITARGEDRADDSAAVARHRFAVYLEKTRPLIDYYAGRGILVKVDGGPAIDAVSQEIFAALDQLQ